MHLRGNFKNLQKIRRFIVKSVKIKNSSDLVELHKNPQNPF